MSEQSSIIGPGTRITGSIEGEGDLQVQGRVEGSLQLDGILVVDGGALVVADVQAAQAIIHGALQGHITTRELVHLSTEARVIGDLTAPRVAIDAGAQYSGRVSMEQDLQSGGTRAGARRPPGGRPAPPLGRRISAEPVRPSPAVAIRTREPQPGAEAEAAAGKPARIGREEARSGAEATEPAPAQPPVRRERASRKPPKPPTAAGKKARTRRK